MQGAGWEKKGSPLREAKIGGAGASGVAGMRRDISVSECRRPKILLATPPYRFLTPSLALEVFFSASQTHRTGSDCREQLSRARADWADGRRSVVSSDCQLSAREVASVKLVVYAARWLCRKGKTTDGKRVSERT